MMYDALPPLERKLGFHRTSNAQVGRKDWINAGHLLTTALGEKAATPETRARERKSFIIDILLWCARE